MAFSEYMNFNIKIRSRQTFSLGLRQYTEKNVQVGQCSFLLLNIPKKAKETTFTEKNVQVVGQCSCLLLNIPK